MFADWDCIFRKPRAGGDDRNKPGHDGVEESIISALGITPKARSSESWRLPFIVMPTKVANKGSRGWRAFARHDEVTAPRRQS
jgi:hypothetical protein